MDVLSGCCLYTTCVPVDRRHQKAVSDPLGLETSNYHGVLLTTALSLQPLPQPSFYAIF